MKNNHTLLLACIALFTVSCNRDNISLPSNEEAHQFHIATELPVVDCMDSKASSKPQVTLKWNTGDSVSVVNLTTGKTLAGALVATVKDESVSFDGELIGALKAGDKMAAIYPSQGYTTVSAIPDVEIDLSSQLCTSPNDIAFVAYSTFTCVTSGQVDVKSKFSIPVSFSQVAIAGIDPNTAVDYIEVTNVGNKLIMKADKAAGDILCTSSQGKIRVIPSSTSSHSNGSLFAYFAVSESPASADRTITVKALPNIYSTVWASSPISGGKYYTSIAADFSKIEYSPFSVVPTSSLEIGCHSSNLYFNVSSEGLDWTVTTTPELPVSVSKGSDCENLEVVVSIPENEEQTVQSYIIKFESSQISYSFVVKQDVNPDTDYIQFADISLKKFMLGMFDENGDGNISMSEAEYIQTVNCAGKNISDLTGLERCYNLKYLNCSNNYVSEVILPRLEKLETVIAYGNQIEMIDLDGDVSLSGLYVIDVNTNAISGNAVIISGYDQAETLSISFAGTDFTHLSLNNSPSLLSFDISRNTQLEAFDGNGNSNVRSIDLLNLSSLKELYINSCSLESLDLESNVLLENLDCSNNHLSDLSIDTNVALITVDCSDNDIDYLRLFGNTELKFLDASNNKLSMINLRKNTSLLTLDVSGNVDLSALDLSTTTKIQTINASCISLADVNIVNNSDLRELNLLSCESLSSIKAVWNNDLLYRLSITTQKPITALSADGTTYCESVNLDRSNVAICQVNDKLMYVDFRYSKSFMTYDSAVSNLKDNQALPNLEAINRIRTNLSLLSLFAYVPQEIWEEGKTERTESKVWYRSPSNPVTSKATYYNVYAYNLGTGEYRTIEFGDRLKPRGDMGYTTEYQGCEAVPVMYIYYLTK